MHDDFMPQAFMPQAFMPQAFMPQGEWLVTTRQPKFGYFPQPEKLSHWASV
jgi:hypothetical protein